MWIKSPARSGTTVSNTTAAPPPRPHPITPPLSREELGRSTWSMIHTTIGHLPDQLSPEQSQAMIQLLQSLTVVYPCHICRRHFAAYMSQHPLPAIDDAAATTTTTTILTRADFAEWACRAHNSVNARLGKPEFSCQTIDQHWPSELKGDCGCDAEDPIDSITITTTGGPTSDKLLMSGIETKV